jgi:hypothetical protein
MFVRILPILLLMLITFLALPADAKSVAKNVDVSVRRIGVFGPWKALRFSEGGSPVCYMMGRPKAVKATKPPKNKTTELKRGEIYLMVTLRPSENTNPVVSYKSGYLFKSGSEALVNAGDKNFRLFTERDQAWARSGSIDRAIVDSLRSGKSLKIEGKAGGGEKSVDVFDLAGSSAAYKAISDACGFRSRNPEVRNQKNKKQEVKNIKNKGQKYSSSNLF